MATPRQRPCRLRSTRRGARAASATGISCCSTPSARASLGARRWSSSRQPFVATFSPAKVFMAKYTGEFALQFVTHLCNHYSVPELVRLARLGHEKGFAQIWVNDNVRYRGQLVVLTAIAANVPVHIGTAILVPYFHQPLELAGALGALSELAGGREICVGIAQGDLGQAPQHVEIAKPVAMVRETARLLRGALNGEEVAYADFPLLCDYFRLNRSGKFTLAFKARAPFAFFGGGNGPQSLRMCGRTMDGVISSGTFIPMLRAGRQAKMLAEADAAARESQPGKR